MARRLVQRGLRDPLDEAEVKAGFNGRLITNRPTDRRLPRTLDLVGDDEHQRARGTRLSRFPSTTNVLGTRATRRCRYGNLKCMSAASVERCHGREASVVERQGAPVRMLLKKALGRQAGHRLTVTRGIGSYLRP
jgi:hypothetical protein